MNTGRLFVFSGIDGAGKSTQIRRLAEHLTVQGTPTRMVWSRVGYTPGMNLVRRMARTLLGARVVPPPGPGPARDRTMARSWVRRWWLRLAMVDLLWYWGGWLRLCKGLGYTVLCDRYWWDSELDLRLHFPQDEATGWWLWHLVVAVCPLPDRAFLLVIPWNEYQNRAARKGDPFPLSAADFHCRWQHYLREDTPLSWLVLDGMRSEMEVAESIATALKPDEASVTSSC